MLNYSNPNTPLTAGRYEYSATLIKGPARPGSHAGHIRSGTYVPPRGATVGQLLEGLRTLHARETGGSPSDVSIVSYWLREA